MPTHFFNTAKSWNNPEFAENDSKSIIKTSFNARVGRVGLFAVVHYSFMDHFLAAAAMSARK